MKAPLFWNTHNWMSNLLLPVSHIYRFIARRRYAAITPANVSVPIICIGNLVAGGAGKTPVAIALMDLLAPHIDGEWFLTRGYGGSTQGPLKVDEKCDFNEVGDEPLLLAQHAPTMMAKNRLDGAQAAIAQGATLLVMDDGFQNPSLKKTLSILVIDGAYGLGNERILPSGPLRESLEDGLAHAHAVVIIGEDKKHIAARISANIPVFKATAIQNVSALDKGQKILAFAGIARPEKFHIALRDLGFYVVSMMGFPDHHPYSAKDIATLKATAEQRDACLVTTQKDAVRLPPEFRAEVKIIGLTLQFEQPEKLKAFCMDALSHA
jgi:tetraacyldisaccharide 4'-kinase